MEKREELERLKAEQERLLKQERDEKAGLERDREEQAALLQNVQQHLKQLHEERQNAEEQMKVSFWRPGQMRECLFGMFYIRKIKNKGNILNCSYLEKRINQNLAPSPKGNNSRFHE